MLGSGSGTAIILPAGSASKHQNSTALRILRRAKVLVFHDARQLNHTFSEGHHFPSIVAHVLAATLARNYHLVGVKGSIDQPVAKSQEVEIDVRQDIVRHRRLLGEAEVNLDVWVREEEVHVKD